MKTGVFYVYWFYDMQWFWIRICVSFHDENLSNYFKIDAYVVRKPSKVTGPENDGKYIEGH